MGKRATFLIDEAVLDEAKHIVKRKSFKSLNFFVELAIRDQIERIRKTEINEAILEASQDPLFLSDLREVENDFVYVDYEQDIEQT